MAFEFNMLEVLTAQFFQGHTAAFGKGVVVLREGIKRLVQSHAKPNSSFLNILIISDLYYGGNKSTDLVKEAKLTKNSGLEVIAELHVNKAEEPVQKITKFLSDSAGSATLLKTFNEPPNKDAGNYDLHALYALLAELELKGPNLKFNIERTIFDGLDSSQAQKEFPDTVIDKEEKSLGATVRTSAFWDSNNPLPSILDEQYDLILMRRGLCYCGKSSACCGCSRKDNSDVAFLTKVLALLRPTETSAAYLAGWNAKDERARWVEAVKEFLKENNKCVVQIEDAYLNEAFKADYMSGIFLSKGRAFSANKMKVK